MYPLPPAVLLQPGCVLRSRKYDIYQAVPHLILDVMLILL